MSERRGGEVTRLPLDFNEIAHSVPSADFDLNTEEMLEQLGDDELRSIALARLMGFTLEENSANLNCTTEESCAS